MKTASKRTASILRRVAPACAFALSSAVLVAACDDTSSPANKPTDLSTLQFDLGGVVSGINDTHCQGADGTVTLYAVDQNACHSTATLDAGPAKDGGADAGASAAAIASATRYNNIGYDNGCKYLVKWQATRIEQKKDVWFQVSAQTSVGNLAATAAAPTADVFFGDSSHPALAGSSAVTATETSAGTYVIGPYQFDAAGQWTTRFNFFGTCTDAPTSPGGHSAFFVAVPATATAGDQ